MSTMVVAQCSGHSSKSWGEHHEPDFDHINPLFLLHWLLKQDLI